MDTKTLQWCAIGDSFTYLNEHLDETGYRVKMGYLDMIRKELPELCLNNIGINGSKVSDWILQPIPYADIYTILLGTNDWNAGRPLGTQEDFDAKKEGTILGDYAVLLEHIFEANPSAAVVAGNPVERADFVYCASYFNNAGGSYARREGRSLAEVAEAIFTACRRMGRVTALDLHTDSGFTQENVIRFKRVKKDGIYRNLPYPDYIGVPFDPEHDEYPYPLEAVGLTYDGLHPSDEGNRIIAGLFAAAMKRALNREPSSR